MWNFNVIIYVFSNHTRSIWVPCKVVILVRHYTLKKSFDEMKIVSFNKVFNSLSLCFVGVVVQNILDVYNLVYFCSIVDWFNLIKTRSPHLLPIFVRRVGRSNNTPLKVASGVSMNIISEIYISQSEI